MGVSIPQVIILLGVIAIPFVLFGPILRKAGFSIWWVLLLFIPVVNGISIWVFAFIEWPAQKEHNNAFKRDAEKAPRPLT